MVLGRKCFLFFKKRGHLFVVEFGRSCGARNRSHWVHFFPVHRDSRQNGGWTLIASCEAAVYLGGHEPVPHGTIALESGSELRPDSWHPFRFESIWALP